MDRVIVRARCIFSAPLHRAHIQLRLWPSRSTRIMQLIRCLHPSSFFFFSSPSSYSGRPSKMLFLLTLSLPFFFQQLFLSRTFYFIVLKPVADFSKCQGQRATNVRARYCREETLKCLIVVCVYKRLHEIIHFYGNVPSNFFFFSSSVHLVRFVLSVGRIDERVNLENHREKQLCWTLMFFFFHFPSYSPWLTQKHQGPIDSLFLSRTL